MFATRFVEMRVVCWGLSAIFSGSRTSYRSVKSATVEGAWLVPAEGDRDRCHIIKEY